MVGGVARSDALLTFDSFAVRDMMLHLICATNRVSVSYQFTPSNAPGALLTEAMLDAVAVLNAAYQAAFLACASCVVLGGLIAATCHSRPRAPARNDPTRGDTVPAEGMTREAEEVDRRGTVPPQISRERGTGEVRDGGLADMETTRRGDIARGKPKPPS